MNNPYRVPVFTTIFNQKGVLMDTLIGQGLVLMLLGMGMVFSFLMLMIYIMNRLAAFFIRFGHHFPDATVTLAVTATGPCAEPEIAVILAAIRAKQRK
ncbi:MAG: OadG family protein [bacterium]